MNTAVSFKTDRLWILNIGDLKMLEQPLEWFLSLAYDFPRWPLNSLDEWWELWADREFGLQGDEIAQREIADIAAIYAVNSISVVTALKHSLTNPVVCLSIKSGTTQLLDFFAC